MLVNISKAFRKAVSGKVDREGAIEDLQRLFGIKRHVEVLFQHLKYVAKRAFRKFNFPSFQYSGAASGSGRGSTFLEAFWRLARSPGLSCTEYLPLRDWKLTFPDFTKTSSNFSFCKRAR